MISHPTTHAHTCTGCCCGWQTFKVKVFDAVVRHLAVLHSKQGRAVRHNRHNQKSPFFAYREVLPLERVGVRRAHEQQQCRRKQQHERSPGHEGESACSSLTRADRDQDATLSSPSSSPSPSAYPKDETLGGSYNDKKVEQRGTCRWPQQYELVYGRIASGFPCIKLAKE